MSSKNPCCLALWAVLRHVLTKIECIKNSFIFFPFFVYLEAQKNRATITGKHRISSWYHSQMDQKPFNIWLTHPNSWMWEWNLKKKKVLIYFKTYFSSTTFIYTPKTSHIQIHVIHMVRKCQISTHLEHYSVFVRHLVCYSQRSIT